MGNEKYIICDKCNQSVHSRQKKDHEKVNCIEIQEKILEKRVDKELALIEKEEKIKKKKIEIDNRQCTVCGMKIRRTNTLKTHMLSHSNTKSFECKKCDLKFVYRTSMRRHMKSKLHHGIGKSDTDIIKQYFTEGKSELDIKLEKMIEKKGKEKWECRLCQRQTPYRTVFITQIIK